MKYSLKLSDEPSELIRQAILDPLVAYNNSMAGPHNHRTLVISLEDGNEKCVGGLYGRTSYRWLFIELIFVAESMRGQGIGRELVQMAEKEAVQRKCHAVWLDTFEFQAKRFYEKLGYHTFGKTDDYPFGFSRYFLKKSLSKAV